MRQKEYAISQTQIDLFLSSNRKNNERQCRENKCDDYRRHRRGDSRWEGYRGSNEIRFLGSADYQGRTMREGSAKKNSYGKSRNGRTNINMEEQRSNESETSESFGVPDCSLRSGELDNEKT